MQQADGAPKGGAHLGPIQIAVLALVGFIAIAGAIVTIVEPSTLSFETYSTQLIPELVAGLGVLGIGKGLHLGLAGQKEQQVLGDAPTILKAIESGQVAQALAATEADISGESVKPGEALPTDEQEEQNPPPADTTPPSLPEPIADAGPNIPPGTGLAADDAGQVTAPLPEVAPPPPVQQPPPPPAPLPSPEEIAAAQATLRAAGLTQE